MGFSVEGLRFRAQGLRLRLGGLNFRFEVEGLGFEGLGYMAWSLSLEVTPTPSRKIEDFL